MNALEYQELAMRTKNRGLQAREQLAVAGLGLVGEAGEVAEHIKKHIGHGQPLSLLELEKELGDVCWYIALVCESVGLTMSDVMTQNVEKLKKRWPDGFDQTKPQAAGE